MRAIRLVAIALLAWPMQSRADTVRFSDTVFPNANWSATKFLDGSFSAFQVATGGNPDQFRQTDQSMNPGESIFVVHTNSSAVYNPSVNGALGTVNCSFNIKFVGGSTGTSQVAHRLALEQAGSFYFANDFVVALGPGNGQPGAWQSFSSSGLTSSDFSKLSGAGTLDFSASGSPITFGYLTTNTAGVTSISTSSGIDNWSVTLNPTDQLLNISTRLRVLTGDNVLIGGFIITGSVPKKVLLRAIGPSLAPFGLTGVLADPTLELHTPGGAVITNDNWRSTQQAEIEATGIPPMNDLESALLVTLSPGNHTAIVRGTNNGTGLALVEGYDLESGSESQFANISTRGLVGTGDDVLIGGIIVGPTGTSSNNFLTRATGPSLSKFGIQNPLQDPTLELHDSSGVTIASNDNWQDSQEAEIQATGIPPTDAHESGVLATLAPGNYTAIVRGKNGTTGVALVEAYKIE